MATFRSYTQYEDETIGFENKRDKKKLKSNTY